MNCAATIFFNILEVYRIEQLRLRKPFLVSSADSSYLLNLGLYHNLYFKGAC